MQGFRLFKSLIDTILTFEFGHDIMKKTAVFDKADHIAISFM